MAHHTDRADARLRQTAACLLRCDVAAFQRVVSGGNNRIYRVDANGGGRYALKTYLKQPNDRRDRIGAETRGLDFIWTHGLRQVPRVHAFDAEESCALFDWIEGQPVETPTADDVDAAVAFLAALKELRTAPEAALLPPASEACLSAAELCRQIAGRRARLSSNGDEALAEFLGREFAAAWDQADRQARNGYRDAGWDFDIPLAPEQQTLSHSDFGFHNALRTDGGELVFVDFEYFGWDDPVKLVADFDVLRVLYDDVLRFHADEPRWAGRDRCILSKGHGRLALYAVLADKGFFPMDELDRFCRHDGKGKGVAFAENDMRWHHKSGISEQELAEIHAAVEA